MLAAPIHPSNPISGWITPDHLGPWAAVAFFGGVAVLIAGAYVLFVLRTMIWDRTSMEDLFAVALAAAEGLVSLTALFVVAWFSVTDGWAATSTVIAVLCAGVLVAESAVAPAVLGLNHSLERAGFIAITVVVEAAFFCLFVVVIAAARVGVMT